MTPSKSENRQFLRPEVTSSHEKLFSVFLDQFTLPEDFMKIRPDVLDKSSKIKNDNNSKEKETEEKH